MNLFTNYSLRAEIKIFLFEKNQKNDLNVGFDLKVYEC